MRARPRPSSPARARRPCCRRRARRGRAAAAAARPVSSDARTPGVVEDDVVLPRFGRGCRCRSSTTSRIAFSRCASVERVDHRQARDSARPAGPTCPCTCPTCAIDRLRSGEERRHHHLIAEHEVVDDRVVAVELPAPRLGRRRRAHHRDVIAPLAVAIEVVVVQLAERVVEAHDVARLLQPLGAQRGAEQADRRPRAAPASSRGSSRPGARRSPGSSTCATPGRRREDVVLSRCSGGERGEERVGGLAHRLGRDAGRAHRKQTRSSTCPFVVMPLNGSARPFRLRVPGHLEEPRPPLLVGFARAGRDVTATRQRRAAPAARAILAMRRILANRRVSKLE